MASVRSDSEYSYYKQMLLYSVIECVYSLTAQVLTIEEKDSDEENLLPMEDLLPTGAYGETWALDVEPAVIGN